jgi:sugar lactone lactonase YvrE
MSAIAPARRAWPNNIGLGWLHRNATKRRSHRQRRDLISVAPASALLRRPGPPEPVSRVDPPGASDPRFSEVPPHGGLLLLLYDQATFSEGPTRWPARDMLLCSDIVGCRILGWHASGSVRVAEDQTLSEPTVFAAIEPGVPDGFRVDRRGWVWTSSEAGVQVFSADGHRLGLVPTPQPCSNCCFGPDERRLFITSKQHHYALDLAGA